MAPRVGPSQIFLKNLLSDNAVKILSALCKLPFAVVNKVGLGDTFGTTQGYNLH